MGLFSYLKHLVYHDANTSKRLNNLQRKVDSIHAQLDGLQLQWRIESLKAKTLTSDEPGISDKEYCDKEVIVSLTSFGKRIHDVYLAIESIMQGTLKPNRIVLWLGESEFSGKPLPLTLQKQQLRGLEISFCKDIRSYTKLIYSLRSFPESIIITIDDDVIYEYDVLERLLNAHLQHPNSICACRTHQVVLGEDHKPVSYLDWKWEVESNDDANRLLFPTGVGGVLYPPRCFPNEVLNEQAFMTLCPYADDIWFYAMEVLNGTPVVHVFTGRPEGYFYRLLSSGYDSLQKDNIDPTSCRNDSQLKAVFDKYNLYEKL